MNELIYSYGRCKSLNDKWWIDRAKLVNRLYYVNSGNAIIYYANKEHFLTEGNIYLLPSVEDFCSVNACNFDHTFFDYYTDRVLKFNSFMELPADFCNLDLIFSFLNKLLDSGNADDTIIFHTFATIMAIIEHNAKPDYITNKIISQALSIIRTNFSELSVTALAESLCLNKSYFIQLFKKHLGMSPMKYIRIFKLETGKQLLNQGESVNYVSEYCGYSTPNAFCKAFQREYGCSPSKFKMQ